MGATGGRNNPEKQDNTSSGCSGPDPREHKPYDSTVIFAKARICLCTITLFYQRTVDPLALPPGELAGPRGDPRVRVAFRRRACAFLGARRPRRGRRSRDAIPPVCSKPFLKNTAPSLQEMQLSGKALLATAVNLRKKKVLLMVNYKGLGF